MTHTIYKVYCSTCNKHQKKKMSWYRYAKYMIKDGRSEGYYEMDSSYIPTGQEPVVCPFGHPLRTERTVMIIVDEPEIIA